LFDLDNNPSPVKVERKKLSSLRLNPSMLEIKPIAVLEDTESTTEVSFDQVAFDKNKLQE